MLRLAPPTQSDASTAALLPPAPQYTCRPTRIDKAQTHLQASPLRDLGDWEFPCATTRNVFSAHPCVEPHLQASSVAASTIVSNMSSRLSHMQCPSFPDAVESPSSRGFNPFRDHQQRVPPLFHCFRLRAKPHRGGAKAVAPPKILVAVCPPLVERKLLHTKPAAAFGWLRR